MECNFIGSHPMKTKSGKKRKVTELDGFYFTYPGQPLLERIRKDGIKEVVEWWSLLPKMPNGGYEKKKYRITVEELS